MAEWLRREIRILMGLPASVQIRLVSFFIYIDNTDAYATLQNEFFGA